MTVVAHLAFILALTGILCEYGHKFLMNSLYPLYNKLEGYTDKRGIMMHYQSVIAKAKNPLFVARAAHRSFKTYQKTKDKKTRDDFLMLIEWIVDRETVKDSASTWYHDYPYGYHMTPPWASALTQGAVAMALYDAYELTGDSKYRSMANGAINSFLVSIEDGGVTYFENDSTWWYEEYADINGDNPKILNGFMFSLLWIHDIKIRGKSQTADLLFRNGVRALKKHLSAYDTGWWTYYDRLGYLASDSYHKIHMQLLTKIAKITRDETFKYYSYTWREYSASFIRRFFINLSRVRLNISQQVVVVIYLIISFVLNRLIFGKFPMRVKRVLRRNTFIARNHQESV